MGAAVVEGRASRPQRSDKMRVGRRREAEVGARELLEWGKWVLKTKKGVVLTG